MVATADGASVIRPTLAIRHLSDEARVISLENAEHLVLSLIAKPLDCIVGELNNALSGKIDGIHYILSTTCLDLSLVNFGNPAIGAKKGPNLILYSPDSHTDKTVFISSMADGWMSLVNVLCKNLAADAVRLSTKSHTVRYPFNSFNYYHKGQNIRIIQSMLDGDRPAFYQKGELLPFENPDFYKKRRVLDRLNRAIIIEYMQKLGYDITDDRFWAANRDAYFLKWLSWDVRNGNA